MSISKTITFLQPAQYTIPVACNGQAIVEAGTAEPFLLEPNSQVFFPQGTFTITIIPLSEDARLSIFDEDPWDSYDPSEELI